MPSAPSDKDPNSAWSKGQAQFSGYASATTHPHDVILTLTPQDDSKQYSEYFDPCQEAADRSLKCLRRNGGDRAMCTDYFEKYKDCKKSWMEEMKEAKRKQSKGWFS